MAKKEKTDGSETRAERRTRQAAEVLEAEKDAAEEFRVKGLEVSMDAKHIRIRMGNQSVYINTSRFGELNEKLAEARSAEVERLQSEIKKLALLDGTAETVQIITKAPLAVHPGVGAESSSAEDTGMRYDVVQKNKTYIMGQCYTCNKSIDSNQGQPCVMCKYTSHKKCIDSGVCGTCLDKADED